MARAVVFGAPGETLANERHRAHLTRVLNGTTGDSPVDSRRYFPAPDQPTTTSTHDHAE